ncbi:protein serine phosphatase with GAF(s) sensor(s) [Parafrankia sp. EAN1pec]|uniref:PP2C family protein-serine/threonine phosphatase n=1 Tax=Parafrankia sp. (strain EAN1pec) TaxID=298653 RepID=UPI000054064D|nr:protein serine phosphatase with GAF(s) sensor(s) [Frankia sp. EAN1pec]
MDNAPAPEGTGPARDAGPDQAASVLLRAEPEEPFDRLTRLAAVMLGAPFAFVMAMDDGRSYWKSRAGTAAGDLTGRQIAAADSLCRLAVGTGLPLVVPDAGRDDRVRGDSLVRSAGIRAWASFPLRDPSGRTLGAFGAADVRPRLWTARDLELLETLAQAVSGEIALRHVAAAATALARTLQQSLLPPEVPEIPGLEVSARYRPAGEGAEVLGDFFDVFQTGRTSFGVVLGDVAGKGVEAAKVTALAHYTIRAAASRTRDPAAILNQLNRALLTQHPDSERFLTVAYMAVDRSRRNRTLALCSAGHTPVLLRGRDGTVTPIGSHGLVLGVFEDPELTTSRPRFGPGDTILLYTDGVTEARRGNDQYGDDRLRALLAATDPAAGRLTATIEAAVLDFADGPPQDDIAILAIHFPDISSVAMKTVRSRLRSRRRPRRPFTRRGTPTV